MCFLSKFAKKELKNYLFLVCILLFTSCSFNKENTTQTLTIATAANMQVALSEIAKQFSKETGIDCELVVSSSGKLTAQIKQGAPFHVFVAADLKYPQEIYDSGLAWSPPEVYAYGKLVLWTTQQELTPSLNSLNREAIQHIALANPKTAPYGRAAMEVIKAYQLEEEIHSKLVYGESIAQTNQFILSGAADIGFTAQSIVLSPAMKGKGKWIEVDTTSYQPIEQGIVVLKGIKVEEAKRFYNFLFSKDAQEILRNFGYSVN